MVGRFGSSAGVLPVGVVDAVDVVSLPEEVLSEVRRFMVGRSGSSAGAEVLLLVEPGSEAVVDGSEPAVSEPRRFMVGRSGSPLADGLVVLEVVVASGLLFVWVAAGLL
jgi:hypothetical protein